MATSYTQAEAGRTVGGLWCECGTAACLCDPGECPPGMNCAQVQQTPPTEDEVETGNDFPIEPGTIILLTFFAAIFITRFR